MMGARDARAVVESAEWAAVAGDHASAARLLNEAAVLQEASLGPLHPDLANTLNNLAVLHERLGRQDAAEDCYRRAYAIATASLAPDHPFVATSGRNLREFCEARGIPFARPRDLPERDAVPLAAQARGVSRSSRALIIGAACALVLLAAGLVAARIWLSVGAGAGFAPDEPAPGPPPVRTATPGPAPAPDVPAPEPRTVTPAGVPPTGVSGAPRATDRAAAPVSVVDARVCRTLSTAGPGDWDCAPANTVDAPGTFFFYTRLKSAADTTVEHRWYRGGRLHQTVELAIQASPVSGFRTYSRQTVGAHRGGDWRVEVRTKDGELLDEARFTVR